MQHEFTVRILGWVSHLGRRVCPSVALAHSPMGVPCRGPWLAIEKSRQVEPQSLGVCVFWGALFHLERDTNKDFRFFFFGGAGEAPLFQTTCQLQYLFQGFLGFDPRPQKNIRPFQCLLERICWRRGLTNLFRVLGLTT